MYTVPEASLNRVIITNSSLYNGLTGRDILSSVSLNKIKSKLGKDWYIEFCNRFLSLLESILYNNPWPDEKVSFEVFNYWKKCDEIVIGGGVLTEFVRDIEKYLTPRFNKIFPTKNIRVLNDSMNIPLNGLVNYSKNSDGLYIDFGHTSVKYSTIYCNKRTNFNPISINLNSSNEDSSIDYSKKLNSKLIYIIEKILVNTEFKGNKVYISIAAYLKDDLFQRNFRGAYCMLRNLNISCSLYFQDIFSKLTGMFLEIEVFHDGEASALNLNRSPSAIIIFGTSLAYGFL